MTPFPRDLFEPRTSEARSRREGATCLDEIRGRDGREMRSFNSAGRGEIGKKASSSTGTRACSNGPRDVFRKSASSTRQICSLSEFDARCIGRRSGRAAHLGAIRGIERYEPWPRNRFADECEHDPRSTLHGAGRIEWSKAAVELPTLGVTRAKSRTAICSLQRKNAEGSQSGRIW